MLAEQIISYVKDCCARDVALLKSLQSAGSLESGAEHLDLCVRKATVSNTTCEQYVVTNQRGNNGSIMYKRAVESVFGKDCAAKRLQAEVCMAAAMRSLTPAKIPATLYSNPADGVLITQHLSPHLIVRHELWTGIRYPLFASDMSSYLASTLLGTGPWCAPQARDTTVLAAMARLEGELEGNREMKDMTERLVFVAPFDSSFDGSAVLGNRVVSLPADSALRPWIHALREDPAIRAAVQQLRQQFSSSAECLLHGDLTTGTLMCAVTRAGPTRVNLETLRPDEYIGRGGEEPQPAVGDMKVIDGERACLGPAGYDLGTLMGSLMLAHCSARARVRKEEVAIAKGGYAKYAATKARDRWLEHAAGVAEWIQETWSQFTARFVSCWDRSLGSSASPGAPCCDTHHNDGCADQGGKEAVDEQLWKEQVTVLGKILSCSVGVSACEIVRRVIGVEGASEIAALEPPHMRTGTEARLVAIAIEVLRTGQEIAAGVLRHALAASSREEAMDRMACGYDPLLACVMTIEAEPGWAAVDAGKGDAADLPGRLHAATFDLLAKSPVFEGNILTTSGP